MPLASDPGITVEELRLAARNHAMPLEALRWPITPVGLHYLLIHYDVPLVDPAAWRLEVGGAVEHPVSFGLDELRARPAVEIAANPAEVEQYRGGKQGLLGFFVGQVMRGTGGKADPRVVNERVREKLAG